MFIEGCVSKGYLQALEAAGYEFQLVVQSGEEASRLIDDNCDLPDPEDHDYEADPWIRIYVDCGIEDFISEEQAVEFAKEVQKLPLLIGNSDPKIAAAVERALKK